MKSFLCLQQQTFQAVMLSQTDGLPDLALGADLQDPSVLFLQMKLMPRVQCIVFSYHCLCFLVSRGAGRGQCTSRSNQLQYRPQHSPRSRKVAYTTSLGIAISTLLSPVSFPSRKRPHSFGNAETSENLCALGKKVDHW